VQVEAGEKFATPVLVHVTVPVGELPVTVAVHDEVAPPVTEEGEQLTDVVVGISAPAREKLPRLPRLFASPPKVTVMITGEVEESSLYDAEHIPVESVQVEKAGGNGPVPLLDHVTVPVGVDPLTVAKHVTDEPTMADGGEQLTEVVVMNRSETTETVLSPALATNTSPSAEL